MTPALPFEPDAFPAGIGPAPRRAARGPSSSFIDRLIHPILSRQAAITRAHFEKGEALWGFILDVHPDARQKKPIHSMNYGLCLVAPELDPGQACLELPDIMSRVMEESANCPSNWDEEQKNFMTRFSNQSVNAPEYMTIPKAWVGGINCGLLLTRFPQATIPGRSLRKEILPLLVSWDRPVATVLPEAYWPPDFKEFWYASREQVSMPEDLIAFEGSGLPADESWLKQLHHQVTVGLESAGISCLFVNTGCMFSEARTPVPGSGGIHVLGKSSERDQLFALLQTIVTTACGEFSDSNITFEEMELDEFFGTFGHMFEDS
jgi:hypothetical protein